ncbi:hypothetical protein Q7C36_007637 [Tachysurus vachellii]|uniref:Uncharacterized protein n=1 Tax=Tachysurus vachellii TaxID=175792 RepID=A0AA88SZP0_TACVA|nr:hypothetical protein Q7C36_007637 [Tachysurus vachellii]
MTSYPGDLNPTERNGIERPSCTKRVNVRHVPLHLFIIRCGGEEEMRAGVEIQQDSLLANWNDIPTSRERDRYRQRHQQEQCPFV